MADREKLIDILMEPCYPQMGYEEANVLIDHILEYGMTFVKTTDVPGKWISVEDEKPADFVSVLGHMTDAGEMPAVRECYHVENGFYFPALREIHPVDRWAYMPE